MRNVLTTVLVLLAVLGAAACGGSTGSSEGGSTGGSEEGQAVTIAGIPKATNIDFYRQTQAGAECAASTLENVELEWDGPTTIDVGNQINIVQNKLTSGVDGIALAALDANALAPVVQQARAKGVAVTTFDSGVDPQPEEVPLFATDNVDGAVKMSDLISKNVGSEGGEVALIRFNPGSQTDNERTKGFKQGLQDHPEIELVAVQNGEANLDTALSVATDILTAHPEVKAIFGAEERAAVGAALAVERAGLTDQVTVYGWDAAPDEIEQLKAGTIQAILVQDPFKMGYDSVEAAVKIVRGESVASEDTGGTIVTKESLNSPEVQKIIDPSCEKRGSQLREEAG